VRPGQLLERRREQIRELQRRLRERAAGTLRSLKGLFATVEARLGLLSPMNVLERGFSITTDAASGRVIRDAAEVEPGRRLKTRLKKGEIRSVAEGDI
jgi:exodeoxyribonuclease VII large subunit